MLSEILATARIAEITSHQGTREKEMPIRVELSNQTAHFILFLLRDDHPYTHPANADRVTKVI